MIDWLYVLTPIVMIANAIIYRNLWNFLSLVGMVASVAYFIIFVLDVMLPLRIDENVDLYT